MKVKTLINEIRFINEHIKENKGVFTIDVKKLNSILDYIDELEEENKKKQEVIANLLKDSADLQLRINKAIDYIENMPYVEIPDDDYENNHKMVEWDDSELLKILKGEE